jgi:pyruvate carboxylase
VRVHGRRLILVSGCGGQNVATGNRAQDVPFSATVQQLEERARSFGLETPTPVDFYVKQARQRDERYRRNGKTLVVGLQAVGETDDGAIRVFFELDGQPRMVKVPNRAVASTRSMRRKAEKGNDARVFHRDRWGAPGPSDGCFLVRKVHAPAPVVRQFVANLSHS